MEKTTVPVLEMSCVVCAGNVERTVAGLDGVGIGQFRRQFADGGVRRTENKFAADKEGRAGCRL